MTEDDGSCHEGSSPRVRGAGVMPLPDKSLSRIIPARAGSRRFEALTACRLADHPRACGEQTINKNFSFSIAGSSPRVRGAGCRVVVERRSAGIIPARAGSSSACAVPRSC